MESTDAHCCVVHVSIDVFTPRLAQHPTDRTSRRLNPASPPSIVFFLAETRDSHPSSGVVSTSVRVKNGGPFGIKEMAEIQIVKFKQKKKPHENPA